MPAIRLYMRYLAWTRRAVGPWAERHPVLGFLAGMGLLAATAALAAAVRA
ncbi:MAG: hypothetical protein IMW98_07560 [Firmicutes bacterium]|nr:hypothetical protein [Bacillota bacterium]